MTLYFKGFLIESATANYMKLYIDVHNLSIYIWSCKKSKFTFKVSVVGILRVFKLKK